MAVWMLLVGRAANGDAHQDDGDWGAVEKGM